MVTTIPEDVDFYKIAKEALSALTSKISIFTPKDLKTGMFRKMSNGEGFVVINDKLIYEIGGWGRISHFNNNMECTNCRIDLVCEANCFDNIKWSDKIYYKR